MKIRLSNLTLILNYRQLRKHMDLPNKICTSNELYKVQINYGKIELVKLNIKNLTKALINFGKIQLVKLSMKNQMLSLTMNLLVPFNIKDIIMTKFRKYSSMMSIKMTTCLLTFLLSMPKKKCLKVKEEHKKIQMIIRGTMKKHQEVMTFTQLSRNKLGKRIVSKRKQMKINVK